MHAACGEVSDCSVDIYQCNIARKWNIFPELQIISVNFSASRNSVALCCNYSGIDNMVGGGSSQPSKLRSKIYQMHKKVLLLSTKYLSI